MKTVWFGRRRPRGVDRRDMLPAGGWCRRPPAQWQPSAVLAALVRLDAAADPELADGAATAEPLRRAVPPL